MSIYNTQNIEANYKSTTIRDVEANIQVSIDKPSRAEYVNKVLNYVLAQLCVTTLITMYMYYNRVSVINKLNANSGLFWFPIIMTFITLALMFCDKKNRKCWFWSFTVCCSFMVGMSTMMYSPAIVAKAVITCGCIVAFVNAYAIYCVKNNKDLEFLEPMLGAGLIMILVVSILNMFIKSEGLHLIITFFGIILFTGFLLYDLNRLYDKGNEDMMDDPMLAAVEIYLDIINLFLYLLEAYDQCNKDDN